jgi:hypothetical protein
MKKMTFVRKSLTPFLGLVVSLSVLSLDALAVDRDKTKFNPPDLDTVETKLTVGGVTIAAVPYDRESLASTAFGKMNPYEHGVLPVLVVIRNDTKGTIRLERMKVEYHDKDKRAVDATPAADVRFLQPPKRPTFGGPFPGLGRKPKNPLAGPEIEIRAFSARMLPPGESAHGFFYFRTGHRSGSTLYVTGLEEASTSKELFYFEVPLD